MNAIAASLLSCLLIAFVRTVNSYADSYTRIYSLTVTLKSKLAESQSNIGAKLVINGSAYFKPDENRKQAYHFGLHNLKISISGKSAQIPDLTKCSCFSEEAEALKLPVLAVYDDDGLFKHVEVSSDETDISSDLKLLMVVNMQVNKQKLKERNESKFTIEANEYIFLKSRNVTYNVQSKVVTTDITSYSIRKSFKAKPKISSNKHIEDDMCNVGSKKDYKHSKNYSMEYEMSNNWDLIKKVEINEHKSYNPFRGSSKKLSIDTKTSINFVKLEENPAQENFKDEDPTVVFSLSPSKSSEESGESSEGSKGVKTHSLKELHHAFMCDREARPLLGALLKKGIQCAVKSNIT